MIKDLVGKKFGRWTVLRFDKRKGSSSYWFCKCDCGNIGRVRGTDLTSCQSLSCGCLRREITSKRLTLHGMTKTREYKSWQAMKDRCLNPKNSVYQYYGNRGIKICKRWLKFENFYADMGDRKKGMSLDRLDNDGNYCKENCAWRSAKKQCRNRRSNVNITYKGKTQCMKAWAEELEINYSTLCGRIQIYKWSIERAFNKNILCD